MFVLLRRLVRNSYLYTNLTGICAMDTQKGEQFIVLAVGCGPPLGLKKDSSQNSSSLAVLHCE